MHALLEHIVNSKRDSLERILAFARDRDLAKEMGVAKRDFKSALLSEDGPNIIAEIKHASPSKGLLTDSFEPARVAREYERGGAVALSILTDEPYFRGSPRYLLEAKRATELPALCKDFMIDTRQMNWAKSIGADAALLIVRILSAAQFRELYQAACEEGLDVLVETHTENEIEFALESGAEIIGVNCRDLDTFEVDLSRTQELASLLPDNVITVAESGIRDNRDIRLLQRHNYNAYLIGETLMTSSDRVAALCQLRGESA